MELTSLPLRIATRYLKQAGYFSVGDFILYGKYKNKRGKIVAITTDEKGHPTVTIEPIPKGRKQNKTMQLFKIWHAPKAEKEAFLKREAHLQMIGDLGTDGLRMASDLLETVAKDTKAGQAWLERTISALASELGRMKSPAAEDLVGRVGEALGVFKAVKSEANALGIQEAILSLQDELGYGSVQIQPFLAKLLPYVGKISEFYVRLRSKYNRLLNKQLGRQFDKNLNKLDFAEAMGKLELASVTPPKPSGLSLVKTLTVLMGVAQDAGDKWTYWFARGLKKTVEYHLARGAHKHPLTALQLNQMNEKLEQYGIEKPHHPWEVP